VVHYPTDVIGGFISGAIGAVVAFFAVRYILTLIERRRDKPFFKFIMEFDALEFVKSLLSRKTAE